MKSLLDRSFRYTPSFETNIKSTFARVRKEMLREAQAKAGQGQAQGKVLSLKQEKLRAVPRTTLERPLEREAQ